MSEKPNPYTTDEVRLDYSEFSRVASENAKNLPRVTVMTEEVNRLRWLLEGRDTFIVDKGLWNEFVEWAAKRASPECADG